MRFLLLFTAASIWVSGCANTAPSYDINATESLGRIVSKNVMGVRNQAAADSWNAGPSLVGLVGVAGLALGDALQKKTVVQVYEYRIRISPSKEVTALSDYSVHQIGECVKVFESQMPTYPRFVSDEGCEK